MKLHGSTEGNLSAALISARRLQGVPVHHDTLRYWSNLVQHADEELLACAALPSQPLTRLVAELRSELLSFQADGEADRLAPLVLAKRAAKGAAETPR
jgi:hypothetical protein